MRKILLLLLLISASLFSTTQDLRGIDSLKKDLAGQKEDSLKLKTLNRLGWAYLFFKPDSANYYGEQMLRLADSLNLKKWGDEGSKFLWAAEYVKGNYYKAIEIITRMMHRHEEENDMRAVAENLNGLYNCYRDMGDHRRALIMIQRSKNILDSLGIITSGVFTNLGNAYESLNQLDSALYYANKGYEIEYIKNKGTWTWPMYQLGVIHAKLRNYELALVYYRLSKAMAIEHNVFKDVIDNDNGFANIFKEKNQLDSVIYYSKDALKYQNTVFYTKGAMEAAANLAHAYKLQGNVDSTLKYFELSAALKDSIYSQQKTMQVQNLAFIEQERQKEIADRNQKEKLQRKHNLQYALIGIGLISFLILFFLLSQSIIVRTGLIRFLGIIALLLVFEFINLYIHPYLVSVTNDTPLLMLLVMVCIASLLVPAHHRLEKWATTKLVDKNKKIRLEAAKKTIARLEGETTS